MATVEECWPLDAVRLMHGRNPLRLFTSRTITWSEAWTSKELSSAGYSVRPAASGLLLTLNYRSSREKPVELPIVLIPTYPHLGGKRWWFICPLILNGVECNPRVRKLYLRGRYFGCRHCHNLTYRSCQEAHRFERTGLRLARYAGCDPEVGLALGRNGRKVSR
jgi:hypothetical protein